MKTSRRTLLAILVIGAVAIGAFAISQRGGDDRRELTFNEFRTLIGDGEIASAELEERADKVTGELADGTRYGVRYAAEYADELIDQLGAADPPIEITVDKHTASIWVSLLYQLLPILFLVGIFLFFINSMQGGGRLMQFGKSKARQFDKDQPKVMFVDVAGCEEAIEELKEIRDYLADPARFQAVGATFPRGVLLVGPPGTGKTLLARAVAGEAGVPFFSISGSDFVEMFVGVGASRVRDLFSQAKNTAPAIIFVDEIDAVGRHRGAGLGGGHDEREQTLNQLLVEMDGFEATSGVIVIAATNRPDILDPALLRPGRFDRHVVVDRPDLAGRRAIAAVHSKGKPLSPEVSADLIARRTAGFTGADIANLLNEAAILAVRRSKAVIGPDEVADATDRVMAGAERRSSLMSDRDKQVVAYHEAGHALVGHVLPNTDPIHKVSIIARGRALGWTLALPTEDRYLRSRSELLDELAMLLGGRTAEEIIFGDPTTGAANDIERATHVARAMVTEFGMSETLGPLQLGRKEGEVFLGKEVGHEANYSNEVAAAIDHEVRRIIDAAHSEAREILTLHRATLDQLAAALVERETLDEEALHEIFGDVADGAKGVRMPPAWSIPRPAVSGAAASEALRAERSTTLDPRSPESVSSINQEHP